MWSFLLTASALAIAPAEVPNPRPSGWVTDLGDVIDAEDEAAINRQIDAMHAAMGVEVAVVTIPSIDDRTPKEFTTQLFNHWGIGDAQADNGLLVLLAVEQRRLEMETGYGLEEPLPAGWLKGVQSDFMVPRFKQGDFGGGIEAGLDQVDARLRGEPVRQGISGPGSTHEPHDSDLGETLVLGLLGTGGVGTMFLFGLGLVWNHRRLRTCPDCELRMELLSESEEDDFLSAGEEREERIGSKSWDVYRCPDCEYVRTFGRVHWFSGYSACPQCRHRTRKTSTIVLTPAGTCTSGTNQVTETCAHCSYHSTYTVTTPPLGDNHSSSSSSGFSSGGGGFGGGSSGGGGAGSSW